MDTRLHNELNRYIDIIEIMNFKQVLCIPFESEGKKENLFVYYHYENGILLVFDTYGENSVNGGHLYYNWMSSSRDFYRYTSSGSCVSHSKKSFGHYWLDENTPFHLSDELQLQEPKDLDFDKIETWKDLALKEVIEKDAKIIYSGYHDCRESLIWNIERLEQNGTFVPKWKKNPFLWLLHHKDTKDENYDYKQINKERIAMLPKEIQDNLGYVK